MIESMIINGISYDIDASECWYDEVLYKGNIYFVRVYDISNEINLFMIEVAVRYNDRIDTDVLSREIRKKKLRDTGESILNSKINEITRK